MFLSLTLLGEHLFYGKACWSRTSSRKRSADSLSLFGCTGGGQCFRFFAVL